MKPLLCSLLCSTLLASSAFAGPPKQAKEDRSVTAAKKAVVTAVVKPLAVREESRSKFSRARMPAAERRVRVLDAKATKDAQGQAFLAFAVDERFGFEGDTWSQAAVTGCVYPETGKVFVKKGDAYKNPEVLVGKKTDATPAHVCQAGENQEMAALPQTPDSALAAALEVLPPS